MQYGTRNTAADLVGYLNTAISEAFNDFSVVYLDDILTYSNSKEEHNKHGMWVIYPLLEAGLYLKWEKCEFHKDSIKYLSLIIST